MKAKFKIGILEIESEGDPEEIAAIAQALSRRALTGLALNRGGTEVSPSDEVDDVEAAATDGGASGHEGPLPDARRFFTDHAPTNNREAAAVGAYYLKHEAPGAQRSGVVSKESLEEVFREAKWKLPKRIDQMLVDTANAGYLKRVDVGKYELTNVGHNLVMHTLEPSRQAG